MFQKVIFILTLVLVIAPLSVKASGQACGYSINTMYVNDQEGRAVKNVRLSVTRKDPRDDYNPHFQEASKTYWDGDRKAYVYQHGLCGEHTGLLLTISAEGFDVLERAFDLPLGWQAFAITLKRKGTEERTIFNALSCKEDTTVCVRTIYH